MTDLMPLPEMDLWPAAVFALSLLPMIGIPGLAAVEGEVAVAASAAVASL